MTASDYQRLTKAALGRHFADVRLEWSVVKDATDDLAADVRRYAPRVDIAVGPFSTTRGQNRQIADDVLAPDALRAVFADRLPNPNPRCLLAIEVTFSGSSKHIMGDILNASALGLYGLVVGKDELMPKIRRIGKYVEVLAQLEKMPPLFRNVITLSTTEFNALLD